MRIYTNSVFYRHDTGPGHPETATRLDAAFEGVRRAGMLREIVRDAPEHPDTNRIITRVHIPHYVEQFAATAGGGARLFQSLDNPISSDSYRAARLAVATALDAADDVWIRQRTRRAFVVARPPGHHAERAEALGFCFFNTIACVAEFLREVAAVERVLIFDWDVHHGNGTQHIFEERDDVFYVSTHQYPFYPGTGAAEEIGTGMGRGMTRNFPLPAGSGDAAYLRVVEEQVIPLVDEYCPGAILISAGFDAHRRDPLADMQVTERAFGEISRRMIEAADRHCGGRILSLLEGGYDPEGLAASVMEHLAAGGQS